MRNVIFLLGVLFFCLFILSILNNWERNVTVFFHPFSPSSSYGVKTHQQKKTNTQRILPLKRRIRCVHRRSEGPSLAPVVYRRSGSKASAGPKDGAGRPGKHSEALGTKRSNCSTSVARRCEWFGKPRIGNYIKKNRPIPKKEIQILEREKNSPIRGCAVYSCTMYAVWRISECNNGCSSGCAITCCTNSPVDNAAHRFQGSSPTQGSASDIIVSTSHATSTTADT